MRAPFNRTMNVWTGPEFGGFLKFAGVPYRYVRRDESAGIPSSPPFTGWITSPITQPLRGSQTDSLSRFDLGRGDYLYDTFTLDLIGVVLWAEEWLIGTANAYQRSYVAPPSALITTTAGLAFGLNAIEPQPPPSPYALRLAFGLSCLEPPPGPEWFQCGLAVALYGQEGSVPNAITTIALALSLIGWTPGTPEPATHLALAFGLEAFQPLPPVEEYLSALALSLIAWVPGPPVPETHAGFAFNITAA